MLLDWIDDRNRSELCHAPRAFRRSASHLCRSATTGSALVAGHGLGTLIQARHQSFLNVPSRHVADAASTVSWSEVLMKARIGVLTIGVDDLERALAFYRDGLGLPSQGIVGTAFERGAVVFFDRLLARAWPVVDARDGPDPARLPHVQRRVRDARSGRRASRARGELTGTGGRCTVDGEGRSRIL